ncbi:aquaporin-4-like [Argonauta hians]
MSETPLRSKLMSLKEDLKSNSFWKAVRCEFLTTLLYTFIGCGSWTLWKQEEQRQIMDDRRFIENELKIALTFGLATATLVQCVGHISGAHLNPAVTIAMLVTRNVNVLRAIFYIIAQCGGAITGAGILFGLTPFEAHGLLGVTKIHADMAKGQAFGVEFMITFIMVFTFFANLDPKRSDMGSRSLSIGLSVTLGQLFALNYTGASMNPARSLGPAVIMQIWEDHWVYWVGPMLGGIIGGFTYEYTHDSSDQMQQFRRSFRKNKSNLRRSRSVNSSTNSMSTELTFSPTAEQPRI